MGMKGECECGPVWPEQAIGAICFQCDNVILEWVP